MPNLDKANSYKGILAVGPNKELAMDNFRKAVLGNKIATLSSGQDTYVIHNDDLHAIFNPSNGELDLESVTTPQEITASLSSLSGRMSSESGSKVEANYLVCAHGCGSHIVFEQEEAVKFCPVCATSVEEPMPSMSAKDDSKDDSDSDSETDETDDTDDAETDDTDDADSEDDADTVDDDSKAKLMETVEEAMDTFVDETEAKMAEEDATDTEDTLDSDTDTDPSVEASAQTKTAIANTETNVNPENTNKPELDGKGPAEAAAPTPPVPATADQNSTKPTVEVNVVQQQPASPAGAADSQTNTTGNEKPAEEVKKAESHSNVEMKGLVVAASTFKRAKAIYAKAAKGKGLQAVASSTNAYLTSVSDSIAFDPANEEVLEKAANFEITDAEREAIANVDNVEYKVCSTGCGSHVLASTEIIGCPVCSTKLDEPESDPTVATEAVAAESTSSRASKMAMEDMTDGDSDMDDEDDEMAEDSDDSDLEDDSDDEDSDTDDDSDDEDSDTDDDSDDEDSDDEDDEDMDESDMLKKTSKSTVATPIATPVPTEEITLDMMDQVTVDSSADNLSLSYVSGMQNGKAAWVAFQNGTPVAYATEASVGQNADIFTDHAFANAVIAGSRKNGVKNSLTQMGFVAYEVKASVQAEVAKQVAAQVEVARGELEATAKSRDDRFMAALATAAIGINRGFYANTVNPIKAQFFDTLSSVGITDAEILIDNVFQSTSDSYHKLLLERAQDILSKTPETQEELAQSILSMNFRRADGQSVSNTKSSFGAIGEKKTVVEPKVTTSAVVAESNINERHARLLQGMKFGPRKS